MSKKLIINKCHECPHWDHRGAYAEVSGVPMCRKMKGRELPHSVERRANSGRLYAKPLYTIPDWCPLPDND